MSNKEALDFLCVPNSGGKLKKQRMQRVEKEKNNRKVRKILILKGKDSEEDILILGKKLKGEERIGIVTFPLHFREYQEIIKRAKQQKKFPRKVKVEGVLTGQTGKELVYGELGLEEEKIFEKKVDYKKNKKKGFLNFLKNFVKKIIKLS